MKSALMPYVAKAVSSQGLRDAKRKVCSLKRQWTGRAPVVDVFLKVDDPYSYLLVQALVDFDSRFNVQLRYHVFCDIDTDMYPRLDMWTRYATYDAAHLANLYDLDFPDAPFTANPQTTVDPHNAVDQQAFAQLAAELVDIEQTPSFLAQACERLKDFWYGTNRVNSSPALTDQARAQLASNYRLLKQKGHYLGAMLNMEGEWYWGIDRLDHLERRLIDQGFAHHANEQVRFNRTYAQFCQRPPTKPASDSPLVLYWSARSPYSYIGLERAVQLARHYQIPLDIRPVLPMMMRGMYVPPVKKMYIFLDTKREAQKLGLPYGFVADPLGAAVERCYALVDYARSQGKLEDFLLSFARGVNTEGIRAETDKGLEQIVSRCGLDWQTAQSKLNNNDWQSWAQQNLDDMFALGCWGVPTMAYGHQHFWGQDRFGMIEEAIRKE